MVGGDGDLGQAVAGIREADVDALPLSGDVSLVERGQCADRGVQRSGAVDDRDAGANRRHALVAGDHGDAGHGLADGVVADLLAVGTELPVRGDVDHDDAGVQRLQRVVPEAHLLDGPRPEVLHEHVRDLDQLTQDCLPFVLAQVHAEALLTAVVLDPVRALLADPRPVIPSFLAPQALDLDDFRAQTSEDLGAAGSCLMPPQIDHADTVQGPSAVCHGVAPWCVAPYASWISASRMRPSISMPSRDRRARSRYARSPGMRISSTPSCRGVALIAAISEDSSRR